MNRTLRALAGLALLALLSAGCGNAVAETAASNGGNSNPAQAIPTPVGPPATVSAGVGANITSSTHDQAVKFAECMRKNGVKDFPDPSASGGFTIDGIINGSSLDPSSAAWKRAITACKDLQLPGFAGNKRTPEQQQAGLKFAQCIRDNGVKDFPDPDPDGPLVDTNRVPSAATGGGTSILNAAMRKCRGFAADAGVTGGR